MSKQNVDTLLRINEAFNRGDVDAALELMDPEVELHPGLQVPDEEALYAGHSGIKEWFESATEAWESVSMEREEVLEGAGDRYLVVDRWLFRGRDGIELELELPTMFIFRGGLVFRIIGFTNRDEALDASRSEDLSTD